MANDRIFLQCPVCREGRLIYKYYPSGGYSNPERLTDGIDFMEDHIKMCGNRFGPDLDGDPFFRLVTETGMSLDDWKIIIKPRGDAATHGR